MDRLFEQAARALANPLSRRQTFSQLWKVAAGVVVAGVVASPAFAQKGTNNNAGGNGKGSASGGACSQQRTSNQTWGQYCTSIGLVCCSEGTAPAACKCGSGCYDCGAGSPSNTGICCSCGKCSPTEYGCTHGVCG